MLIRFITILFLFIIFSYSPIADWLESSMLLHMLVQLPILVTLGYNFAHYFLTDFNCVKQLNEKGIAGIILVITTTAYWMLPRALDAALVETMMAMAKYFSLFFLVGVPLALSWKLLHPVIKAVVQIEFIVMLFRLGWLYLVSPTRLCNAYQLSEQILLGKSLLIIALTISMYWCLNLFLFDNSKPRNSHTMSVN